MLTCMRSAADECTGDSTARFALRDRAIHSIRSKIVRTILLEELRFHRLSIRIQKAETAEQLHERLLIRKLPIGRERYAG